LTQLTLLRMCIILSLNILNNILEKIMKIWYFENTHRDESNILYDIIYLCILVEKYSQSKLGQNYIFSNESSIAGRREYKIRWHQIETCLSSVGTIMKHENGYIILFPTSSTVWRCAHSLLAYPKTGIDVVSWASKHMKVRICGGPFTSPKDYQSSSRACISPCWTYKQSKSKNGE